MFPGSAETGGRDTDGLLAAAAGADGLPQAETRPVVAARPAVPDKNVRRLTLLELTVTSRPTCCAVGSSVLGKLTGPRAV
jgi:hypothetical protein